MGIFLKNIQIPDFLKILSMGTELFHGGGRTDLAKLIVALSNFSNVPQNVNRIPQHDASNYKMSDVINCDPQASSHRLLCQGTYRRDGLAMPTATLTCAMSPKKQRILRCYDPQQQTEGITECEDR